MLKVDLFDFHRCVVGDRRLVCHGQTHELKIKDAYITLRGRVIGRFKVCIHDDSMGSSLYDVVFRWGI